MHTFTKQQRQGGPKYQSRTLIGNWSEELDQYASTMKSFLEQRRAGTLKTDRCTLCMLCGACTSKTCQILCSWLWPLVGLQSHTVGVSHLHCSAAYRCCSTLGLVLIHCLMPLLQAHPEGADWPSLC